jgi:RNA polymerase sigma-70 factor (ECF subfamily)
MADHSEVVRLLIEHRIDLFAFILAAVRDNRAAEEVMQNVAVVICNKSDQYECGTNFRAWAREIARRQILQFNREKKRGPGTLSPSELEYLVTAFDEAERDGLLEDRLNALRACLESLSKAARRFIRLRYEERLSLGQMAERSNLRPESLRKSLYRARIALRKCIDGRLELTS